MLPVYTAQHRILHQCGWVYWTPRTLRSGFSANLPNLGLRTLPPLGGYCLGIYLRHTLQTGDLGAGERASGKTRTCRPLLVRSDWLLATGEFEQAEISITSELELSQRAGSRDEEGEHATFLAKIRQILGDLAGAERLGRFAVEKAKREVPGELHTGSLLAGIYAEMGYPGRAQPHLTRCREILGNGEDWRGLAGKVARAEAVVAAAEGKYQRRRSAVRESSRDFSAISCAIRGSRGTALLGTGAECVGRARSRE